MLNDKPFFDERNCVSMKAKNLGYTSMVLLLFIAFGAMAPHPYHVSYTELNYTPEKKELTFAIEVFTDDLENAIKLDYKPEKFFLGSDSISAESENLIKKYMENKCRVIVDGIVLKDLQWMGVESTPDRTNIYFSYANLPPFSSLAFYNTILVSLFPDQQNIVEFITSNKKQKALLSKEKTNVTWMIGS